MKMDAVKMFNLIKKSLAGMKKNEDYVYMSLYFDIDGNWIGAKETIYKTTIEDAVFTTNSKSDYAMQHNELMKLLNSLKETKGWGGLYFKTERMSTEYYWERGSEYVSAVGVAPAPCKEYKSLMNYLNKYANANLTNYRLFSSRMGGKRGRLWDEYGERYFLDNKPMKCQAELDTLRANRGSKDIMTCRYGEEDYIDDFEKRHSEYYEVECEGEKRRYIEVTIKTPSGKVKMVRKFY